METGVGGSHEASFASPQRLKVFTGMVEDFKSFDEVMKTWSEKLELFVCLSSALLLFFERLVIKHRGAPKMIKNEHGLCRDLYPANSRPVVIDSYR